MVEIPAGFERHFRRSPVTDPWEPLYSRRSKTAITLGLWSADNHTNSRGVVHGGLLSALADNTMGLNCALQAGEGVRVVTVSLAVDFLSPIECGRWVEIDTPFVKVGGSLCFAQAFITADGMPCVRANGTFRIMRRQDASGQNSSGQERAA